MFSKRFPAFISGAVILTAALFASACHESKNETKDTELALHPLAQSSAPPTNQIIAQATPAPSAVSASPPPPPNPRDVREAMARVFDKVLAWDEHHMPNLLIGDFNGDGSEDLAVFGTANENSLADLNNELANWTLEDPRLVPIPGKPPTEPGLRVVPVRAQKGDSLLAIIHGVAAQGWRNHEARQTYLLKAANGSNMTVQKVESMKTAAVETHLPPLKGDVISERLAGDSGILFWTGAKYAWYAPAKNER